MNSHGEFISSRLIQNEWDAPGPHPQPFSQWEKGDKSSPSHLGLAKYTIALASLALGLNTAAASQLGERLCSSISG
jgi:hypothetical protein